jgi:hypothetical protein
VAIAGRLGDGHGLLLVRGRSAAVERWLRRGLVPAGLAPLGGWTGVVLGEERARSAAPYDVGLEVLAARPVPVRCRPVIGFFDVRGRAVLTLQQRVLRHGQSWLVWEPRVGVVDVPELPRLRLGALLTAAGATGRVRHEQIAEILRSGTGAPIDTLIAVLSLLGLPGRELLTAGATSGMLVVEPSPGGVAAFDRMVAEDTEIRAHRGRR